MLIFYIDGASFIALDGNWSYFLIYQGSKVTILMFNLLRSLGISQHMNKRGL
jgi:hypothetical protein